MELTSENVLSIVYFLGSLQGIILTILLFSANKNIIAARLLGVLTFIWAIDLSAFAMTLQGFMTSHPHFLRTVSHVEFTIFPLFYLSMNYLIKRHEKFKIKDLLHFVPFIFVILLFIPFYFESAETKYNFVATNSGYYFYLNFISNELLAIQGITYSIFALIMIRKYNKSIVDYTSNTDKEILKHYRTGFYILLISWSIGTIAVNLDLVNVNINVNLFLFTYLLIVLVIYVISYYALKSDEIYKLSEEQITYSSLHKGAILNPADENKITGQTELRLSKLNEELVNYMEKRKPYLNSDLGIQDLAKGLGVSRNQLSETINVIHKMNFHEFVNSYRVDTIKSNLKDPGKKHLKIISLAFDAGFNSKASFNRIFKQHTNQTPSQYLVSMQE